VFAGENLEAVELSHSGFKAVKDIYAITVLEKGCMRQGQEQNNFSLFYAPPNEC